MVNERFEISVVVQGHSSHRMPIREYLNKFHSGNLGERRSNLKSSYLDIQNGAGEQVEMGGCFAELMGRQFLWVHDRLLEGKPAFLRYNLLFERQDCYLLFEPEGKGVLVSEFLTVGNKLVLREGVDLQRVDLLKSDPVISSSQDVSNGEFSNRFPFMYWDPGASSEKREIGMRTL